MIKSMSITNDLGEKIKIKLGEPWETGLVIKQIDGLGPVKANVNMTNYATIDGGRFNSSRINERNIVFDLIFYGVDAEKIRLVTYKYLNVKTDVTLEFELDYHEVSIKGHVESNEPDIFSKQESTQVSIICPNPFFAGEIIESNGNNVTPMFEFPFSNPSLTDNLIEFGMIDPNKKIQFIYDGNANNGVEIDVTINGDVSNLTIYKENTNMIIPIDTTKLGDIIGDGSNKFYKYDYIRILTYKGSKSIILFRNGKKYNIIGALPLFINWIETNRGINAFNYIAESGKDNVKVYVKTQNLYNGI